MRCELDRSVLADTLASMVSVLPGKTTYPVLANYCLEVGNRKLALRGTDLDVFVRRELPLEGASEDGRVAVQARKLTELVRESGAERVAIFTRENNVLLEAGGVRAAFVCVAPDEFPEHKPLPEGTAFEFPVATFAEMWEACAFAVGKDDGRPQMTGVNWEVSKSETRMVGTDGHRLAFVLRRGKFPTKFRAILPPKVYATLSRGEDTMQVTADPTHAGFKFTDSQVVCRLLEGPYPDYERVIPKGYPGKAVLVREELASVLRRASVFAHPLGRLVTFEFRKKKLAVRAETPETGRSEEELECDYSGDDLRIGFNVTFVLEVLRHTVAERLEVELGGPLSAAVLRPLNEGADIEKTYLLMPIRLD